MMMKKNTTEKWVCNQSKGLWYCLLKYHQLYNFEWWYAPPLPEEVGHTWLTYLHFLCADFLLLEYSDPTLSKQKGSFIPLPCSHSWPFSSEGTLEEESEDGVRGHLSNSLPDAMENLTITEIRRVNQGLFTTDPPMVRPWLERKQERPVNMFIFNYSSNYSKSIVFTL